MTKIQTILLMVALLFSLAASAQDRQTAKAKLDAKSQVDHRHDFDWEIGDWKVHIRRLQHPLTGSKSWLSSTVRHTSERSGMVGRIFWN